MKETVGTTQTFQYVLIFTFIIVAFLVLSLTYNKVYKLKNESLTIIEKYEGIMQENDYSYTLELINKYLNNTGYTQKGSCNSGEYGVESLTEYKYEAADTSKEYYYCLSDERKNGKIYYTIRLFFKFNLPVIGEIFTFDVTGTTGGIYYYDLKQILG